MSKPELKQIGALSLSDFLRHPVWVGVHTRDTDEPWYDETDEETYRPWTDRYRSVRVSISFSSVLHCNYAMEPSYQDSSRQPAIPGTSLSGPVALP